MSTQFLKGRRNHIIGVPKLIVFLLISMVLALGSSCSPKEASQQADSEPAAETTADSSSGAAPVKYEIAVFIPGALAGSPTYQMLADGVEQAAQEYEQATVKIVEGGFNQSEWQDKVTQLAATGTYELIVSSNPALPEISRRVSSSFPNQKFLLFDGYLEGEENIYTFRYNQFEQAFLAGHLAGLVTTSSMDGANSDLKIGLLAGQEYPDMNQAILPGFERGAQWVEEDIEVDFRVLGNWYDATKAAEMADSMLKSGVDIILTIAGGANQGVLKSSKEHGSYVLWFDTNGYEKAPGTVIGSTALRQEKAAYEKTTQAIEGNLQFGQAEVVGVEEGWVTFLKDDPHFTSNVPESIQEKQADILERMQDGEIGFEMPK